MHIQPNTRTVETHRRPPDLQLWLYRSECSPATGNPRPIAARGLRPQVASIPSSRAWVMSELAEPARMAKMSATVSRSLSGSPLTTRRARSGSPDSSAAMVAASSSTTYPGIRTRGLPPITRRERTVTRARVALRIRRSACCPAARRSRRAMATIRPATAAPSTM
ncbi:hypothetical protein L842_5987 [Mycobacterium intracellulare MIN_052511_1280]|nr:hypothetical protein L842_5987 [Mycobacterium intracellulare MIN_052511_1280]